MDKSKAKRSKPTAADMAAAKRLAEIWKRIPAKLRPTQEQIARRWPEGGTQGLISQYMTGKIPLNYRAVLFFAEALRCDPSEIRSDLPEFETAKSISSGAAGVKEDTANYNVIQFVPRKDSMEIPRFSTKASMGLGIPSPDVETMIGNVTVSMQWIRSDLRHVSSPTNLAVISGYGDSMEGTFADGAQLIVDRGVKDVKIDAIYVLSLNGELYIKRLQRRPDGSILMISDNKKYEPYIIQNGERDKFAVLGRVVGVWNFSKL